MLQVVCVKIGSKFRPEYVRYLQNGIRAHLHMEHDFACLTDDPTNLSCRTLPLIREDLKGWWQKVTLFGDHDYVSNRILYLDLDVVLRGDITEIVSCKAPFAATRDKWVTGINSSFMLWNHDEYKHVYENFTTTSGFNGDQNYITTQVEDPLFVNDEWPEWVKSFKIDLKNDEPRGDERLVFFHGMPRPWDVEWVKEIYKEQRP